MTVEKMRLIPGSISLARKKKKEMKKETNLGNVNFIQYHNVRSFKVIRVVHSQFLEIIKPIISIRSNY